MITQAELKDITHYNPETGSFIWLANIAPRAKIGSEIGEVTVKGNNKYRRVIIYGKKYMVHRLVFLYLNGRLPDGDIDHIDGDGLNNRWLNLRVVSSTSNNRNRRIQRNNKSGVCGVSWDERLMKWHVRCNRIHIGYNHDFFEAVCMRFSAQNNIGGFTERHGK